MGLLKTAADTVYTIRFLKLLVTPFTETDAYKAGIIDDNGDRVPDFDLNLMANREAYRTHYTPFHRLVYNLKRIMAKAPGGQSALARYGSALALIKENGELSDRSINKIHEKTKIQSYEILAEQSQWYVLRDGSLSPGMYRMNNNSMTSEMCLEVVRRGDQIRVSDKSNAPIHNILGINVYEAVHVLSNKRMLVTAAELTK